MTVGCYARYSSELQNELSIEDQERLLTEWVARTMPGAPTRTFSDAAKAGSSLHGRPGMQALLHAARDGDLTVVVAESLDRFSRSQADVAFIFERLLFAGVRVTTLQEGDITELHIGLKGTMNALYLKDLSFKTKRGQRGVFERGQSPGGRRYGYQSVKGETGVLVIDAEEAAVVRRIFRLFVAGVSPKAIVKTLNAEQIPGPRGPWSPSTIHGHVKRGTGVLNNELYIGQRVFGRQRFIKDPDTGKRVARANATWETKAVPALRIVDDDLWQAAKARQATTRAVLRQGLVRARRPVHLLSKLTVCATCGGGFTLRRGDMLRCFNHVVRGTCGNARAISRDEVEGRVLKAVQERFFAPGEFAAFCEAFTEEMNRLRREHRTTLAAAPREIANLDRRSKEILELLLNGFTDEAWKVELAEIGRRRTELQETLAAAAAEPAAPALHPAMATVFREKTEQLAAALQQTNAERRESARQAIRSLIDRITIPPEGVLLVRGNLGEMLKAAGGGAAVSYVGCGGVLPSWASEVAA